MSSFVTCPGCSKKITLTDKLRGRKVKCGCGKLMKMPGSPVAASPPAVVSPVQQRTPAPVVVAPKVVQPVPVSPIPVTPVPVSPIAVEPVSAVPIPVSCSSCFAQFNVNASMAGKSAQCNCGAAIHIPHAGAQAANATDPFGMEAADPLGFSAADPLGVAAAQPYGQPTPPSNPYWAQGGSQSGKPKKRKVKRKKGTIDDQEEWDAGAMGAIGGILLGLLLGGLGVVLTVASMNDEGYTIYYGLMIFGALTSLGGISSLITGD